jgi:hypothetical protein
MRKKLVVLGMILLGWSGVARSQSITQLLTQLELDVQKLTELKTILNDLYTSYSVLDKGYSAIRDIAQGNFSLHKAYLDGLLAISPTVSGYYRVAEIIQNEITIVSEYKAAYRAWSAGGHFSTAELNYISQVYAALLSKSEQCLDALAMVVTADQLRMSDADRLGTIDRIDTDIGSQLNHLRQFNNSTALQAAQRAQEAGDLQTIKSLYGN